MAVTGRPSPANVLVGAGILISVAYLTLSYIPTLSSPLTVSRSRATGLRSSRSVYVDRLRSWCEGGKRLGAAEEWGARDPFSAEIEFDFGNKVRNADTFHMVKPPKNDIFGLKNFRYEPDQEILTEDDLILYENQVSGFWSEEENGKVVLKQEFEVVNHDALGAVKKQVEFARLVGGLENQPSMSWKEEKHEDSDHLGVELSIFSEGYDGLILNDFVFAANINDLDLK
ncbi:hypothetical protein AAMO2058_000665900 [Amorphochlora amoebiformis]